MNEALKDRRCFDESHNSKYLEVGERRQVEERDNVDRCSDGQQQLKLVDRVLAVASPAQAEYLEDRLEVEENCEHDLDVIIILVENVSRSPVMLEVHGRRDDPVRENHRHYDIPKVGRLDDSMAGLVRWSVLVLVDRYQLPSAIVADQHVRCAAALNMPSNSPHLLKLHSNLVEGLGDDSNENVLDQPGEEEDHRAEVECSSPCRKWVDCAIHDEHPALLWSSLVDGEDAREDLLEALIALLVARKEISLHALHSRWALIARAWIHRTKCVGYGEGVDW